MFFEQDWLLEKQKIASNNCSLKLLNCINQCHDQDTNISLAKMSNLSTILKVKNQKLQAKSKVFYYNNQCPLHYKILEQKAKVILMLKQNKNAQNKASQIYKQKQKQKQKQNSEKRQQQFQQIKIKNVKILQKKMYDQIKYSDDNIEIIQQFELCMNFATSLTNMKQLKLNFSRGQVEVRQIDEPNQRKQYKLQNIYHYADLFKLMIQLNKYPLQNKQYLLQMANKQNQISKYLQSKYFIQVIQMVNKQLSYSKYLFNQRVFDQLSKIQDKIHIFTYDSDKQKKYKQKQFIEQQFWQKICYLFSKGEVQYNLIQCHLQQYNHLQLLRHFKASIKGQQSLFQRNIGLFKANQHYRQFLLLLEGKYLDYCLSQKNPEIKNDDLIYYALKEIMILHNIKKSYRYQIDFIKNISNLMIKQLETELQFQISPSVTQIKIQKLLTLSQFNKVFHLLNKYKKITDLQYVYLMSILCQINFQNSLFLSYDHQSIINTLKMIIQSFLTTTQTHNNHYEYYYLLLHAFLPIITRCLKPQRQKQIILQFITYNYPLIMSIIQYKSFYKIFKDFQLNFQDITSIITLLIEKHQLYSYALQFGLSSCVKLHQLNISSTNNSSKDKKIYQRMKQTQILQNKQISCFSHIYLSIFDNFPPQQLNYHQQDRLKIMFFSLQFLIKINLNLLNDIYKRQKYSEEIFFINKLFIKLKIKQQRDIIWKELHLVEWKQYDYKLSCLVSAIIITGSMCKLQNHIYNRQYKQIVDVLNDFYLISDQFSQIKPLLLSIIDHYQLSQMLITFTGDIVQCLQELKLNKEFIIKKNKTILKQLCKWTHIVLKQFGDNNIEESKQTQNQLQQFMASLNYYD